MHSGGRVVVALYKSIWKRGHEREMRGNNMIGERIGKGEKKAIVIG